MRDPATWRSRPGGADVRGRGEIARPIRRGQATRPLQESRTTGATTGQVAEEASRKTTPAESATAPVASRLAGPEALFDRIVSILEEARGRVVRAVNSEMVLAYWHIGREIVLQMQGGQARAEYGQEVLDTLAERLTRRYGKGFSATNLRYFRLFYQVYADRSPEIRHEARDEFAARGGRGRERLQAGEVLAALSSAVDPAEQPRGFASSLTWTHYRTLTKVEHRAERLFYEIEAEKEGWSSLHLERQIHTHLFARLLKSRDKGGVIDLASRGQMLESPVDSLRDPYVLDFLNLPEDRLLRESDLESAIIEKLRNPPYERRLRGVLKPKRPHGWRAAAAVRPPPG